MAAWRLLAIGVLGCIGSFLLELLLRPRAAPPWQRPVGCNLLHLGIWCIWYALGLAIFQRPVFSALTGLAILTLVIMVNNAKFHSLREPFIFQDFEYFTDAIRHPRLYIPFLGWTRAALIAVAIVLAVGIGLALESSQLVVLGTFSYGALIASIFATGTLLLVAGHAACPSATHVPEADLGRLGLLASLWRYWRDEAQVIDVAGIQSSLPRSAVGLGDSTILPDLVVIQSESFFDARRSFGLLNPEILAAFDQIRHEALLHGQLHVPAWGANTVRSEFAFLSGMAPQGLGVHRFNPYRKFVSASPETLATCLRALGYRTLCIHPYPASFYCRDTVYPKIGFDEFIDIAEFASAKCDGPYVGDRALGERTIKELERWRAASDKPLFVFVITMENHGPLHLERVAADDVARLYRAPPPDGCDDLTIYARHLVNADAMFGEIQSSLLYSPRESMLCIYGDHVPIMPGVYSALGEPDGKTDYVLWHNRRIASGNRAIANDIQDLAAILLKEVVRRTQ